MLFQDDSIFFFGSHLKNNVQPKPLKKKKIQLTDQLQQLTMRAFQVGL